MDIFKYFQEMESNKYSEEYKLLVRSIIIKIEDQADKFEFIKTILDCTTYLGAVSIITSFIAQWDYMNIIIVSGSIISVISFIAVVVLNTIKNSTIKNLNKQLQDVKSNQPFLSEEVINLIRKSNDNTLVKTPK